MEVKYYPEVLVTSDFIDREEIEDIEEEDDVPLLHITYEHPLFGLTTETFLYTDETDYLILKSITPHDNQDFDSIQQVKDYYNNFLLGGSETYLEYFNKDIGWYLLTRNDE